MPAEPHPHDVSRWTPRYNPWLIALVVTLATFMEVLDTSIANVSLPHIAGSLGASADEATWILTSYLVASGVVLPISGWLATRFGRKRYYMTCVAIFTVCSFLCGIAPNLPMLILFRIMQGLGGGGLATSEQSILADAFPVSKRGQAFAIYGMAVVIAPAVGPTLGGWITDNYNWHWIFFINIPVGIVSLLLTHRMVDDPPYLEIEKQKSIREKVDFLGLGLVALGVGCLEFVLDKGQEKDWFSDHTITAFAIVSAVALIWFVFWEWNHPDPIVDLRLLQNRNFGTAVFLQFILGMVLFGTTILIPQFCQGLLGYTAERAGLVLSPAGFMMMALMPVSGKLVGKVKDARWLVAIGYFLCAMGLLNLTRLNLGVSYGTLTFWRMIQMVGLPFIFIPISTLNYVGVPQNKNNQISSFSNFARNIGGSVGTAALTTFLIRTQQVHQSAMVANIAGGPNYRAYIAQMTSTMMMQGQSARQAAATAMGFAYQQLGRQASMLSYENAFAALGTVVLFLVPLPFIMRKPPKRAGPPPPAH